MLSAAQPNHIAAQSNTGDAQHTFGNAKHLVSIIRRELTSIDHPGATAG